LQIQEWCLVVDATTRRRDRLTQLHRPEADSLSASCHGPSAWRLLACRFSASFNAVERLLALLVATVCTCAGGAELRFSLAETPAGEVPAGFTNLLAGGGSPGKWQVLMDEVPPLMAPLTPLAPSITRRAVLGQLSKDPTDERFPMLAYDNEVFGDFTLTTRFKIVGGEVEQMAGIAFRLQDERNFYVIRASALGRNLRFYKVVNGARSPLIGPELEISRNEWHDLKVQCIGARIRCELDGRAVLPELNDTTFRMGKIAFWTKSDSVSYFADTVIQYTPRIPLAQQIVTSVMEKNSRLIALQIFAKAAGTNATRIIASKDESDIGKSGGQYESSCIEEGQMFYSKNSSFVALVMPLRDRNGDVVAAARIHMTTFPGQTERNAVIRATPIVKEMEARMKATGDPID
jgi:hypothetical protein